MRSDRVGCVDLFRFFMILLIMSHHLYLFGYSDDFPFRSCWAWVDYFFLLTGYFTMRHYACREVKENHAAEALMYTLRKLAGCFPFVLIAVSAQYLITALPSLVQGNPKQFLSSFSDWPYEVLLLSSSGIVWAKVMPLWFLSAMLLTLPLMIYLMLRFRDFWRIAAWLIPLLYYGQMGINTVRTWPNDLIRAFSCMTLGTFVYLISEKVKTREIRRGNRIWFTIGEAGALFISLYITVLNKDFMNLLPLLFFLHGTIMLSGRSHTALIRGPLCSFLGEISMPVFVFHWTIASAVKDLAAGMELRLALYYLGTLLLSCAAVCLKTIISRRKKPAEPASPKQENRGDCAA